MEVITTANFQPDISFWGLRVGEPMIALTSVLVSLFCFFAFLRLGRIPQPGDALRLFRVFFLLTGLSTFIGGVVGHAFLHQLPFFCKIPGWALGMIAVSAFEQAAIVRAQSWLGPAWTRFFKWTNIIQLTVALWFVFATLWFPAVEIHSAFGMLLVVAPLEIRTFAKNRSQTSKYILQGILLLIVAVTAHIVKISAGVWFCFFDIAHLMMCVAIRAFMLGAIRLEAETFPLAMEELPVRCGN